MLLAERGVAREPVAPFFIRELVCFLFAERLYDTVNNGGDDTIDLTKKRTGLLCLSRGRGEKSKALPICTAFHYLLVPRGPASHALSSLARIFLIGPLRLQPWPPLAGRECRGASAGIVPRKRTKVVPPEERSSFSLVQSLPRYGRHQRAARLATVRFCSGDRDGDGDVARLKVTREADLAFTFSLFRCGSFLHLSLLL